MTRNWNVIFQIFHPFHWHIWNLNFACLFKVICIVSLSKQRQWMKTETCILNYFNSISMIWTRKFKTLPFTWVNSASHSRQCLPKLKAMMQYKISVHHQYVFMRFSLHGFRQKVSISPGWNAVRPSLVVPSMYVIKLQFYYVIFNLMISKDYDSFSSVLDCAFYVKSHTNHH